MEKFHLGLASYSIARQGGNDNTEEDWQAIGDELTMEMKALSENDSKWNFESKFLLLKAEKAFTDGNLEVAAASYDKAVEAAREHRFINEQALASEWTSQCAARFPTWIKETSVEDVNIWSNPEVYMKLGEQRGRLRMFCPCFRA